MQTDILQMTHTSLLFYSVSLKPALSHVEESVFAHRASLPSLKGLTLITNPFHHWHGHIHCNAVCKISRSAHWISLHLPELFQYPGT